MVPVPALGAPCTKASATVEMRQEFRGLGVFWGLGFRI